MGWCVCVCVCVGGGGRYQEAFAVQISDDSVCGPGMPSGVPNRQVIFFSIYKCPDVQKTTVDKFFPVVIYAGCLMCSGGLCGHKYTYSSSTDPLAKNSSIGTKSSLHLHFLHLLLEYGCQILE